MSRPRAWRSGGVAATLVGAALLGIVVVVAPSLLMGAVGLVALLGLVANPVSGILVLYLVRPLIDQSVVLFGLDQVAGQSPSALIGLAILFASLAMILMFQRDRALGSWLHPWWYFAIYVLLCVGLAPSFGEAFGVAGRILAWTMLASAVILIPDIERLQAALPIAAGVSALLISGSAAVGYVIGPRSVYGVGEALGFFANPQGLAFPLVLMLPVLMFGLARDRQRSLLYIIAVIAASAIVFMSLSRTAWIAWGVAVLASGRSIGQLDKRTKRRLLGGAFVAILVVAVAVFAKWDAVIYRFGDLQQGTDVAALGSGRGAIYGAILSAYWRSSPLALLIGNGLGDSIRVTTAAIGAARVAHSDFVWILYETGLVGLLTFVVSTMAVIRTLRRGVRSGVGEYSAVALASVLAMLVMAAFNGVLADGVMTYFAVILGLGLREVMAPADAERGDEA